MRVTQADFSAIQNAYQTQLNANQTAVSVANQASYADYLGTAQSIELGSTITNGILTLATAGVNLYEGIEGYKTSKDSNEANNRLREAALQVQKYAMDADLSGTLLMSDDGGVGVFSEDTQAYMQSLYDSYYDPNWTAETQREFNDAWDRLMKDTESAYMKRDYESTMKGDLGAWEIGAKDAVWVDAASPSGYNAIEAQFSNLPSFINDAQREAMWADYVSQVDYARAKSRIGEMVKNGEDAISYLDNESGYTVGSPEYEELYDYAMRRRAKEETTVRTSYGDAMTNLLSQTYDDGTEVVPADARLKLEKQMAASGLAPVFQSIAWEGIDSSQAIWANNAMTTELRGILDGSASRQDLVDLIESMRTGDNAWRYRGIEDDRDTFIDTSIQPIIDQMDKAPAEALKKATEWYDVQSAIIKGSTASAADKAYELTALGRQEPLIMDKVSADIADLFETDSLLKPAQKSMYESFDKSLRDTLKTRYGSLDEPEAVTLLAKTRADYIQWIQYQAGEGNLTDDKMLQHQTLVLAELLGEGLDSLSSLEEYQEDSSNLIKQGVYSSNVKDLRNVLDLVFDPSLVNDMYLNMDDGIWEHTTEAGAYVWEKQKALLLGTLNRNGINDVTYPVPYEDEAGNIYTYPVVKDKDQNVYRLAYDGVLIQPADGSTPYIIAEYGTEEDTPYKEELSGFKQYLGAVKGMITGDPGYRTVKDDLANASDTDNGIPARRAEDDAEPVSMEPSEPASRIRTATISNLFAGAGGNQGGTLFWYEGAWYDVRQLDRNGEIYRAFLEYSRRQGNADR